MTLEELRQRVSVRRELPPPEVRRALRVSANVSLRELAETVGVSEAALSRWERGERMPRPAARARYTEALEVLGARFGV